MRMKATIGLHPVVGQYSVIVDQLIDVCQSEKCLQSEWPDFSAEVSTTQTAPSSARSGTQ
jgi:hypothetical protein